MTKPNFPKPVIEAAEEYIAFDKSDPFTRHRVYSHMRNGITTMNKSKQDTQPALYLAERRYEDAIAANGSPYKKPYWINITRP